MITPWLEQARGAKQFGNGDRNGGALPRLISNNKSVQLSMSTQSPPKKWAPHINSVLASPNLPKT
ncbi:MAG: hypothetical protein DHS20C11_15030 [Lysobacteraceae bacterium]|nr:MAG: hypothetical protein DHS20C11_15030 [Xanthomonadaceae bacterium]